LPQPRPSGGLFKGCLIAIVVVGVLGFLAIFGLVLLVAVGTAAGMPAASGGSELYTFQEVTVGGTVGAPKIVCIPVEGILGGISGSGFRQPSTPLLVARLRKAREDAGVRGMILYIDSPGGGMTASDILHNEVLQFRQGASGRPVVACMMDMAASGGYYVSTAADWVVAHPTTLTGSIGILMPMYDATRLLKMIGVRDETIATGAFKELGSPFKEKTKEQKEVERQVLGAALAEMHERFVDVVASGRGLDPEQVRELADGRIFTSKQALELKLIDEIGYEAAAVAAVKKLAGEPEVHLVQYQQVLSILDLFGALSAGPRLEVSVQDALPGQHGARPMFLWVPPVPEEAH